MTGGEMADLVQVGTFAGREGDAFRMIAVEEGPGPAGDVRSPEVGVRLAEVEPLGAPPPGAQREPFSLIFSGPAEPILPQGIYRLEHAELGVHEMFLVPLEPAAEGARYQAIFS